MYLLRSSIEEVRINPQIELEVIEETEAHQKINKKEQVER